MNGGHVADPRSAVVQPCARCGARWAVQGKPLHWCPRCHGVLLSPAAVDAPATRRNYRWVARPPGRTAHPAQPSRRPVAPETPRYTQMPRWGLRDLPPQEAVVPRTRFEALIARLPLLLAITAILYGVAVLAELGRYGILLRNRTRLIQPALLWISDGAVTVSSIAAGLAALVTAVALVGWLAQTRRTAYAGVGRQDPRPRFELFLGCLVPVVNLVWPGVFLTEAVREGDNDPRLLRAVRFWWAAWVFNGVLVTVAVLYRLTSSLQARADGVMVTVWADLVAVGVAVLTLWLVRAFAGVDLRGRPATLKRWLPATTPATPVIEPVHPVGAEGAGRRAPNDAVGNDEATVQNPETATAAADGAPEPEHEEVLAK